MTTPPDPAINPADFRDFLVTAFGHLRDGEAIAFRPFQGGKPFSQLRFARDGFDRAVDYIARLAAAPTTTSVYAHCNPVVADKTGAANGDQVTRRAFLFVDVDAVRFGPDGNEWYADGMDDKGKVRRYKVKAAATDAELAEADSLTHHIRRTLIQFGFPPPALDVCTGNGHQLWYSVDLPEGTDDEKKANNNLASDFLHALDREHGGQYGARVDLSTFDAPRLARVPGTMNRKYIGTEDRPQRAARLVFSHPREPVPEALVRKFVEAHAPPADEKAKRGRPPTSGPNGRPTGDALKAGDDYNRRCSDPILDILPPGTTVHRRLSDGEYLQLRRPGVDDHMGATWGYCKNSKGFPLLKVFSDDFHPFEPQKVYDRFGVFAHVQHGGDFKAAARALGALGYGTPLARATFKGGERTPYMPSRERRTPPEDESPTGESAPGDGGGFPFTVGGRTVVVLSSDEMQDRAAVLPAVARDEMLYARMGIIVRPLVTEAKPEKAKKDTPQLTWKKPDGLTSLVPATPNFIRTRIVARCQLMKDKGEKHGLVPRTCPEYLPNGIHADPTGLREVSGLALGPILRPDGSLLNARGYDPASRLYLARPVPGLEELMPETVTQDAAQRKLETVLFPLVTDFPWRKADGLLQASRWFCLFFTALLRHQLQQVPLGLLTANTAGSGKTYLCQIISIIAHGHEPILMTWPEGTKFQSRGEEVRKRLASLLSEGASLSLIDNLTRGEHFHSPELDAFLTSTVFFDRLLGKNDGSKAGGHQQCQLLATGNNVSPSGDTADRTLHVVLESDHPNPRSRPVTEFKARDAIDYAREHRTELLAAGLTCVRGWIQAGCPTPPGESWGSFTEWTNTVVGLVRWLIPCVDPIGGRSSEATSDPETEALVSVLIAWITVFGERIVSTGEILRSVDEPKPDSSFKLTPPQSALREALSEMLGSFTLASAKRLGCALAGFAGRRVGIDDQRTAWLTTHRDKHTKQNVYQVQTAKGL